MGIAMRCVVAALVLVTGCDVTEEVCIDDFEDCMWDCRVEGLDLCQTSCNEAHAECMDTVGETDPDAHRDVLLGLLAVLALLDAVVVDDDEFDDER